MHSIQQQPGASAAMQPCNINRAIVLSAKSHFVHYAGSAEALQISPLTLRSCTSSSLYDVVLPSTLGMYCAVC